MAPASAAHSCGMPPRAPASLLFPLLIAAACGGTTTSLGSVADETPPADNRTEDETKNNPAESETKAETSDGGTERDAGSSSIDGSTPGKACDASSAAPSPCPPGEYCKATNPGTCGSGRCQPFGAPPPPFCGALECGCDGVVRCQGTSASSAGQDVSSAGTPSTPCRVQCGASVCDGLTTYCEHVGGGAPPGTETYTCKPYPAECAINHTCGCVLANDGPPSGGACTSDKDGKVVVTYVAP